MRTESFEEVSPQAAKLLTKDCLHIVAGNVKKYRTEKGLTQNDLAFYLFTEKSVISNIENLKCKNITLCTLIKISKFFNIPLENLLK